MGDRLRSQRLVEARKKGTHTQEEWLWLLQMCELRCVRCGFVFNQDYARERPQKDHIVSLYQGGSDGLENLQPLCMRCNSSKGPEDIDHRPIEVLAELEHYLSSARRTA